MEENNKDNYNIVLSEGEIIDLQGVEWWIKNKKHITLGNSVKKCWLKTLDKILHQAKTEIECNNQQKNMDINVENLWGKLKCLKVSHPNGPHSEAIHYCEDILGFLNCMKTCNENNIRTVELTIVDKFLE